ncbi:methyltransferase domain-containing protein [Paracoccus sp. SCSIO 75233]|uniref:methyltransferase domain-containing protein n=1 Tax=Paracoccus sp. SCSIO 75233 TaxID=3017782 RepID=UPI0022F12BF8|nr:methyltransferase domain-containing protein [Paracoccus sp. SCSIO 75233]WBU52147.1 methyltransferase domain-containing protein [Paracoccus sp. SCSIO 75233]
MHHDVIALRRFYYNRSLGRVAQRILRDRLIATWPPGKATGMNVVGYGFAVPMLRPYLAHARRVIGLMPGPQGVMAWPAGAANHSVLCDETAWPVDTGSVDRLVLLHGLEASDHPSALLAEAWRALGPGGRMLVMVPNRAGLWARTDDTPFGFGRSYTAGQLERQAEEAGFVTERSGAAIYIPPSDRRFWLRSAMWWEKIGMRISSVLVAGVTWAEFSKQAHAPVEPGSRVSVPSPLDVLEGIARPRPARGPTPERAREGLRRNILTD